MQISVPVSNLPKIIEETQKDIEAHGIKYMIAGHAGDGVSWLLKQYLDKPS